MQLPWETIDWRQASDELRREDAAFRSQIEDLFAERQILGTPTRSGAIGLSLFCKPPGSAENWEPPTPESVHRIRARSGRMTWWQAYAAPLLANLHRLPYTFPDHDAHVYLAADLGWMAESLLMPQVVVHLMRHSSLKAQPGAMWRFLSHDIPGIEEAVVFDIEEDWSQPHRCRSLSRWRNSQLALLRYTNPSETPPEMPGLSIYRPMCACFVAFRPQADFSMRQACEAFAALAIRRRIPTTVRHPDVGEQFLFGSSWPDYGMDETFLQQVVFPFFIHRGVFTSFFGTSSEHFFPRDIFVTLMSHPRAVVVRGD